MPLLHDLSPEAFARLLERARQVSPPGERARDRALLAVLYHGRLGVSELCAMRLSELTLENGLPQLGPRPLTGEAQAALHHWLKKRKMMAVHFEAASSTDVDAVWVDARGRTLTEEAAHALLLRLEVAPG